MTDAQILAFGCGVTFLFMAGAYVVFRAWYQETYGGSHSELAEGPTPSLQRNTA